MNIDKDIEKVKENFDLTMYEKTNNVCKILDKNREIFPPGFIEDLIYIFDKLVHEQLKPAQLTVCETLMERQKYEIQKAKDERYEKRIEFLNSELETWKKIAEKLADYIVIADINEDIICDGIPEEICEQRAIGDCKQCIIDWAREEVDKDDN